MWYVSGNRDEDAIERPDEFIIDRARPRQHLCRSASASTAASASASPRCSSRRVGGDAAALPRIEVVGEPTRLYSYFVRGIEVLSGSHSRPDRVEQIVGDYRGRVGPA